MDTNIYFSIAVCSYEQESYPTSVNFFSFAEQNKTHIRAGINLLPSIIFSSQVASQGYLRLLLFRLDINLVLTLKEAGEWGSKSARWSGGCRGSRGR